MKKFIFLYFWVNDRVHNNQFYNLTDQEVDIYIYIEVVRVSLKIPQFRQWDFFGNFCKNIVVYCIHASVDKYEWSLMYKEDSGQTICKYIKL